MFTNYGVDFATVDGLGPVTFYQFLDSDRKFRDWLFTNLDSETEQPSTPIDLTGGIVTARVIRRRFTRLDVTESLVGYEEVVRQVAATITEYTGSRGAPSVFSCPVRVVSATQGLVRVTLDTSAWDTNPTRDSDLDVDATFPAAYELQVKVRWPDAVAEKDDLTGIGLIAVYNNGVQNG